jgi:CubicO group peptidase (beta-lactamase class C family)
MFLAVDSIFRIHLFHGSGESQPPSAGALLNRRSFVTGLCSVCSFVLLRGEFASSEQKSGLEQRVRAQMDLGVSDGLTIGAVMMVIQRDNVLALEAAGYSDLDTQRPMRTDAIFDIRSISKPITVFGALLLVDDGKLRLDDPLAKFLPEFSRVQVKGQTKPTGVPITIRQLMTHTSGIAAERPAELENITRTFDHTLAQTVALVAQQPLDFTPGSKWTYSSSGISVLGRVVEVVSGQPFERFMEQRVFEPLEMRDSSFFTNRAKINRIPTMYTDQRGHLVRDVMDVTRPGQKYPGPEFGLFSTAEDLRHFCQMMLNRGSWQGRMILSPKLIDEMIRPEMPTSFPEYYSGLGWAVHPKEAAEMSYAVTDGSYGANGASGGIVWIDPSLKLIRIYLTHHFGGDSIDADPVMNAALPT